jgi:hypothetical protein
MVRREVEGKGGEWKRKGLKEKFCRVVALSLNQNNPQR